MSRHLYGLQRLYMTFTHISKSNLARGGSRLRSTLFFRAITSFPIRKLIDLIHYRRFQNGTEEVIQGEV